MTTFCCLCKFATFSNISSRTFSSFLLSTTYHSLSSSSATFSFTWDDAFRISQPQTATPHRSTYLQGFFHKVQLCKCNRAPVYGTQMNSYVELDVQKHLWIGKRSGTKSTYPRMLDELVARGLPHGIDCQQNLAQECEEEAGITRSISINTISVGAVSYKDIDGYRYKRDVLFCYDLKLPKDFVPKNKDGEVDSFSLQVDPCYTSCNNHTQDSFSRYITPEYDGYLDLLRSLRIGDCS